MCKQTSSNYEIQRAVQFEQEKLARLQGSELTITTRLPEVYLFKAWSAPKQQKPIQIRNSYVRSHPVIHPPSHHEDNELVLGIEIMRSLIYPIPCGS